MKKESIVLAVCCALSSSMTFAQNVDYSVVAVRQENGRELTQITTNGDYVCMPEVQRTRYGINWYTNRVIDISPNGDKLAFLAIRGGYTNIFIKNIQFLSSSLQRTNRSYITDFSYSPDGSKILFSETVGNANCMFLTDAENGFICRQITSGSRDYSPVYSRDMKNIFFVRQEQDVANIWSYDTEKNFLSSYTSGINPSPVSSSSKILCSRPNGAGGNEIWQIDYSTGVEECILSKPSNSFTTPALSPDGEWIVCTGSTLIQEGDICYWNTDIYVCRSNGLDLTQITFHAADDISPVWSPDGKYIYFISQRGNAEGNANVWRVRFEQ